MNETFFTFRKDLLNALAITYSMAKIIIPFYIVMELVKKTNLIKYVSELLKPFMGPASGQW